MEHRGAQSKQTTMLTSMPTLIQTDSNSSATEVAGVVGKKSPRKEISCNRYLITEQMWVHALTLLGPSEGKTSAEKEAKAKELLVTLNSEKEAIKKKAKSLFTTRMMLKARELQVKYKTEDGREDMVQTIKHVAQSWQDDDSKENAIKIWNILYGQFETDPYWCGGIEHELMNHFWYSYTCDACVDENPECDQYCGGCVGKIAMQAKTEICKNVNRLGKRLHGK